MSYRLDRRTFLTTGTTGMILGSAGLGSASPGGADALRAFQEPAREVPVVKEADVVVCGAGPAGIAAALAAARTGAKTRLLEVNGCLGGVWTAGLLSWILDADNKPGIMQEILARLAKQKVAARYGSSVGYAVEPMKLLLEDLATEAGVAIQLHTRVVNAVKEKRHLKLAVTESKSGRQAWSGKVFIDTTGDGDLAAHAGCGFDYGQEGTGRVQPMSVIALLTGIDAEGMVPFVRGVAEPRGLGSPKDNLLAEMRRAGVDPSYSRPTLFYIREGLFCMMANHEYGVDSRNAQQITDASIRGRREVHKLVDALQARGGPWEKVQIVATPEHIGVREGRRIHGRYTVTTDDMIRGVRHEDAVCEVNFPIDVHSTDPSKEKGIEAKPVRTKPYQIPYRALLARDVDGLLMAGRCISGDFIAHSSYRVTGNSVALGEAAGVGAALAAAGKALPHEVPWAEIARALGHGKSA